MFILDPKHAAEVREFILSEADTVLAQLVPLAGAAYDALRTNNDILGRARRADCRELLDTLCPHMMAALLVIAASELDAAGWAPDPEHPDAAAVDPDAPLPAEPPEVAW